MNCALWKKSWGEAQLLLAASAVLLYAFCWLRVWLTSQLDMSRFQGMLAQLPERWKELSPVPLEHLATYTGRIALAYDDPIVVLMISAWAISRGSDAVSGPLGRGTLELVLAQPVSRLQVLGVHSAVTVFGTALLTLSAWAGTCTGIAATTVKEEARPAKLSVPLGPWKVEVPLPLLSSANRPPQRVPMSEKVDGRDFLPAIANLFSLGFFLTGLTTFLSSWDRYRWRTIGLAVGIYVVQMVFKAIGLAAQGFRWLLDYTVFTAFEPQAMVAVGVSQPEYTWAVTMPATAEEVTKLAPLGNDLVLVGLGAVLYVMAAIVFFRRDLPAPL